MFWNSQNPANIKSGAKKFTFIDFFANQSCPDINWGFVHIQHTASDIKAFP